MTKLFSIPGIDTHKASKIKTKVPKFETYKNISISILKYT